jgi:hypothetical protein
MAAVEVAAPADSMLAAGVVDRRALVAVAGQIVQLSHTHVRHSPSLSLQPSTTLLCSG